MTTLPITHMTLYKHGVGYYRRRGNVEGESLKLTFRREEMDDLLKSLTVIDFSSGQVQGVDYDTPQSQAEKLAGCSVILQDTRSLRDLLLALRGRSVKLSIQDAEEETGLLLGLDEAPEKPLKASLVSLLVEGTERVTVLPISQLKGVSVYDETAAGDLRFFLQTALGQETHRSITIRLSPGEHDLEVSYIAPAPTWRVSYRLVMDAPEVETEAKTKALLQGWGIFDNQLEEDLNDISLSLTAGMPISFVYDLYTPHTPERPVVEDEDRVAAGPVFFESALERETGASEDHLMAPAAPAPMARAALATVKRKTAMSKTVQSAATGQALGELFQYNVSTPVTVGRGQSAMVPIVSSALDIKKDLIYNQAKMPNHPMATIRLMNKTGLTLERGPVTALDGGEYVGEAVLPFTANEAEAVIAYAVELGVHIKETATSARHLHTLQIKDGYLLQNYYLTRKTTYKIDNKTAGGKTVLIEHPLLPNYTIFDTPKPAEKTINTHRYAVKAPAGVLSAFTVKQRILQSSREEIRKLSYRNLQSYFKDKFLDEQTYQGIKHILDTLAEIGKLKTEITKLDKQRSQIYADQTQVQKNMQVLSNKGEEGKLRNQYVQQLVKSETKLAQIGQTVKNTEAKIESLNAKVQHEIDALA